MAVPPDFFLHPQTGRVMPIAGNVAYDPASSTLVLTTDSCTGNTRGACGATGDVLVLYTVDNWSDIPE